MLTKRITMRYIKRGITAAVCILAAFSFYGCGKIDDETEIGKPVYGTMRTAEFTKKPEEDTSLRLDQAEDLSLDSDSQSENESEREITLDDSKEADKELLDDLALLNSAAKSAYEAAVDLLYDKETMGYSYERTLNDGYFVLSHSSSGMAIPGNDTASSEGDILIYDSLFSEGGREYIAYIGVAKLGGEDQPFVQIRIAEAEGVALIGQYPDAVKMQDQNSIKWTEFKIRGADNNSAGKNFNKESEEQRLKDLNEAAKAAYNSAAWIVADKECLGISLEKCMEQGVFAKSHTVDGLVIGFDNICDAEGDISINNEISLGFDDLVVYVGLTDLGHGEDLFVQTRDKIDHNYIGQYPDAVQTSDIGKVIWTEFCFQSDTTTDNDLETLNYAAKEAYNLVSEIASEKYNHGIGIEEMFQQEEFKTAHSAEGLNTYIGAELSSNGDRFLNELIAGEFDGINIYVGYTEIDGETLIFVQTRNDGDGDVIGQYPKPFNEEDRVVWGVFAD